MDQVPSVGRVVHYVAYGTPGGEFPAGVCRAAVITQVLPNDHVGLTVFNPTGLFFPTDVRYADIEARPGKRIPIPGTWHFPERV